MAPKLSSAYGLLLPFFQCSACGLTNHPDRCMLECECINNSLDYTMLVAKQLGGNRLKIVLSSAAYRATNMFMYIL